MNPSRFMRRRVAAVLILLLLPACTHEDSSLPTPAPNLLSPAPRPTVKSPLGECVVGMIRADRAKDGELLDLLGPYVPTWLPDGFGLFIGWKPEGRFEPSAGVIWTDELCRQIRLDILPNGAHEESPQPDGRWVLLDRGTCTLGFVRNAPCLTYHAQVNGDAVTLRTVGLSDGEAGRGVAGIDVSG